MLCAAFCLINLRPKFDRSSVLHEEKIDDRKSDGLSMDHTFDFHQNVKLSSSYSRSNREPLS